MPEVNPFENSEQAYAQILPPVTLPKPQWSVWNANPWNPTCGWISLETGAKWFLRLYMYIFIFLITLIVFTLVLAGFAAAKSDDHVTIPKPIKELNITVTVGNYTHRSFINEVAKYENRFAHESVIILLVSLVWMSLTAYSCYKCRMALEQGTVAQMKKHFWVVLFFVAMDVLGTLLLDQDTLLMVFLEIPMGLFSVFGILFVYTYILERIQTAGGTFGYSRDSTLESA